MPNKKQTQKLKNEIAGSLFLKEDLKKKLLDNLDRLDDKDRETLAALFGHAEKRQDDLLAKIVKYDDTFVPRLDHFITAGIGKFMGGVEKKQRKKEKAEDILKEIE